MPFASIQDIARLVGGGVTVIPTGELPGDARIAQIEASVGVRFPNDYKAFLRLVGSLLVEVHEDIWPRPKVGDIGPHWLQTRYQLNVFGVCAEVDWLRLEVEAQDFRARADASSAELAPVFAWENTSDRICFTRDGSLVEWNRYDGASPLDESFEQVLRRLLAEQRAYKEELLNA